ncbi:hypothetical protein Hanom_Chr13g01190601 [Helianthus anomalus]
MLMFVVHLVEIVVWFVVHVLFSLVFNISRTTTTTHITSFLVHASIQHRRLLIIFLHPWLTL